MTKPDLDSLRGEAQNMIDHPGMVMTTPMLGKKILEAVAYIEELESQEEPCRHLNCEMVSGRKRDYLYCNECEEALDGGDD